MMEQCNQCVDISVAAQILGLGETRARALLDPPDKITYLVNGKARFFYCRQRVEDIARQRECEKCKLAADKGKRPCYLCRTKCQPCELTSGMCADCRAMKLMRNFVCHGDCLLHKPDGQRVKVLCSALKKIISQLSAGKAKNTSQPEPVPSTEN